MRSDNWEILHKFSQKILSTYCGQGVDLHSGDTRVNRIDKTSAFIILPFHRGR